MSLREDAPCDNRGSGARGQAVRRSSSNEPSPVPGKGAALKQAAAPQNAAWLTSTLAPLLALLAVVLFCLNGELLQALQLRMPVTDVHASPGLNLVFCHLGGLMFAPKLLSTGIDYSAAAAAGPAPLSRDGGSLDWLAQHPRVSALFFSFLIMGYNYAWLLSTRFQSVGETNALFQTSVMFVYAASVPIFGEPLTSSRMLGIGVMLFAVAFAGGAEAPFGRRQLPPAPGGLAAGAAGGTLPPTDPGAGLGLGATLTLLAAAGNATYQVLFRRMYGHLKQDFGFLAFFGVWVGVWHLLIILPMLLVASALGMETFQLPRGPTAVTGTIVSAIIASAVNALYLCVNLWGSVMLLPCTTALSVPLTVLLDFVLHGHAPRPTEAIGQVLVVVSVVLILDVLPKSVRGPAAEPARFQSP